MVGDLQNQECRFHPAKLRGPVPTRCKVRHGQATGRASFARQHYSRGCYRDRPTRRDLAGPQPGPARHQRPPNLVRKLMPASHLQDDGDQSSEEEASVQFQLGLLGWGHFCCVGLSLFVPGGQGGRAKQ